MHSASCKLQLVTFNILTSINEFIKKEKENETSFLMN